MSYFGHNIVPLRRLEPAIPQYQVKHSTNDPGDCILNIDPDQAEQSVMHDLDSKSFGTLEVFLEYFFIKKETSRQQFENHPACKACADAEGDRGPPPPPLKNHKNIGFPSNTGPDPL